MWLPPHSETTNLDFSFPSTPEKAQSYLCTQSFRLPGIGAVLFLSLLSHALYLGQCIFLFSQFWVKPIVPVRLLPSVYWSVCSLWDVFKSVTSSSDCSQMSVAYIALVPRPPDHHDLRRALLGYLFPLFLCVKLLIALPFCLFLLVSWSYMCLLNCSLPRCSLLLTMSLGMEFSMLCPK